MWSHRTAEMDHTPSLPRGVQHYIFVDAALTFGAAKENCDALGGQLAEPQSETEAIAIATVAVGNKHWVGGRRKDNLWVWVGSGKAFWRSGTSNEPCSNSVLGMWTRWRNNSQPFPAPMGDCVLSSAGPQPASCSITGSLRCAPRSFHLSAKYTRQRIAVATSTHAPEWTGPLQRPSVPKMEAICWPVCIAPRTQLPWHTWRGASSGWAASGPPPDPRGHGAQTASTAFG